jgi:LL-diaminopimelate aminotransferase
MSTDPWFQPLFAERIGGAKYGKGTEIYKFEKIKRAKRQALADRPNVQLLDFGIGENDDMAPESIRMELARQANRIENRGYADNGIAAYKEAAAAFMKRQFGVTIDPVTEVCHGIGTKPIYAMLPACFINPGDVTLMTVPGYPVAGTWTKYYDGEVHRLPLERKNNFFPDLESISADIKRRAKLLVINYPNSPTGAVATVDFYKRVIDFARKNEIVVVQDAAHILLTYQGDPLSFLQIDGAKDVGIEVHSMSKGFDMIGWRLGFACGHPKLIQAYADVKDNGDSGQFMAIQHAAAAALADPSIPQRIRTKYRRRLEKLVATLKSVGFDCTMPGGTYFLYAASPKGAGDRTFANAEAASQYLIHEQSICCVPWDDAGPFLRFSVTYTANDEAEEDAIMKETTSRLKGLNLRF